MKPAEQDLGAKGGVAGAAVRRKDDGISDAESSSGRCLCSKASRGKPIQP